ncbi:MAG: DUF3482 domain-containing protein [Acidobacteriota bacterium]
MNDTPTEAVAAIDEPTGSPPAITLALVSHTNVGKTTLARTLLRRDVGQVLDQAHVTEEAEIFPLLDTPDGVLQLADTPGFGDSARLLRRLRTEERPVLWFLQQTWDRIADRPFWCSQRAALAIRDQADIVLYLVNATEEPEDAGYVDLELEVIDWLGVPTLILLNQVGDTSFRKEQWLERLDRWQRHTERFDVVRGVTELDAFTRCWVEEHALLSRVVELLPDDRRPLMESLRTAWDARNLEVFDRSIDAVASYLAATAVDRETLPEKRPSREQKQAAMEALGRRLVDRTEELMAALLAHHGLEGEVATEIDRQLDAFAVAGEETLDPERGAWLGGMVSGAVGGLAADLLAGGLTFGGGVLAGAILGALGGAGLARGMQLVQGDRLPEVSWAPPFLDRLLVQAMLRYLAVAHFGRGRGEFRHEDASRRWQDAVDAALREGVESRKALWKDAARLHHADAVRRLRPTVGSAAREILRRGYPDAAGLLA